MLVPYDRGGVRWYMLVAGLVAASLRPAAGWPPALITLAVALPTFAVGLFFRFWAKGCLHQNQEVTNAGPYRFVRHPFYFGNLLVDLSVVVMSGWWPLWCVAPVWWFLVYLPVMRREEKAMIDRFGDAYLAFKQRVPRVIPYRWPLPPKPGFSWQNPNVFKTEVPRTLRLLSYPLLFVLVLQFRTRGWTTEALRHPLVLGIVAAIIVLNVTALLVRRWALKRLAAAAAAGTDSGD